MGLFWGPPTIVSEIGDVPPEERMAKLQPILEQQAAQTGLQSTVERRDYPMWEIVEVF